MAKRLTDKQRKQIVADYVECENYMAVSRKYKISATTVKNIVNANPDSVKRCGLKKEQNTLDMLSFMDSRKEQAQSFVDLCLSYLSDPEKLEKAKVNEITTAMGTVIDKFTALTPVSPTSQSRESVKHLTTEELKALADEYMRKRGDTS